MSLLKKIWRRGLAEQTRFFLQFALFRYFDTPVKKPWSRQKSELKRCRQRYRIPAFHYFTLDLYRCEFERQPECIVPPQFLDHYRDQINRPEHHRLLKNKRVFAELAGKAGLPVVRTWFRIEGNRSLAAEGSEREYSYQELVGTLHDNGIEQIFVKPDRGWKGLDSHAFSVTAQGLADEQGTLSAQAFLARVGSQDTQRSVGSLVQTRLLQHPVLAALNPSCINSVRLVTYISRSGSPDVCSAMLRCGVGGSPVDNVSVGGLAVGIRRIDGVVTGNGQLFQPRKSQVFARHPDTGQVFEGVQIPFWDRCREVCLQAAAVFPELPLAAWDLAITPDGPVFMEGNHRPASEFLQLADNLWATPLGLAVMEARQRGLTQS